MLLVFASMKTLLLFLLMWSPLARSAEPIIINVAFEYDSNELSQLSNDLRDRVKLAFDLVRSVPVQPTTLITSPAKPVHVTVAVTALSSPLIQRWLSGVPGAEDPSLDSFMAELETSTLQRRLMLYMLADRVFFEGPNRRADGHARAVVTLAHNLYGSARHIIQRRLDGNRPDPVPGVLDAFGTGVKFLSLLLSDSNKHLIDDKLRQDFEAALLREEDGKRFWESANANRCGDALGLRRGWQN